MSARKSQQQQFMLTLGDEQVLVHLSAMRRKSMKLQLTPNGEVDLRIPLGCPQGEVLAFVRRHEFWLLQQRADFQQQVSERRHSIMIRGQERPFKQSALDAFLVTDSAVWIPEGWSQADIDQALEGWLRAQARSEYQRMIECWWPAFSKYAEQRPVLRIKKMRTRWGSLSQRGYINLNLALMQLPESLLELVVVHELCHLRHFDHGPGFRALMSECLPDWRQREKCLTAAARLL